MPPPSYEDLWADNQRLRAENRGLLGLDRGHHHAPRVAVIARDEKNRGGGGRGEKDRAQRPAARSSHRAAGARFASAFR